ncbi:hypothetical protein [Psychrobacillus sp. NPDC096389]|uniref:hypothetical protein n=1 Tax=Psychrobacillus sp. NPDC096389 TaxID=3364490 RepID=UPI0037FDE997
MFLSNSKLGEVVKSQVKFKLNAYMGTIVTLIFVQLLGLLFSMNGTGTRGVNIDMSTVYVSVVSYDIIFIFVALWAFVIGNSITTKANDDFSFVTTRLSSNLANIIFLCLISVFAGVTIVLSNYLLRIILLLFGDQNYMENPSIFDASLNSIISMVIMIILILIVSAVGYLRGILVQHNKIFSILLPFLIFVLLVTKSGQSVIQYIFIENTSMVVLVVKLICLSGVVFIFAILCSNRLGVRS